MERAELDSRGVPWETVTRLLDDDASGAAAPRPDWRCPSSAPPTASTAGVHADDLGALLAVTDGDGEMLSEEHGGPRLVFPRPSVGNPPRVSKPGSSSRPSRSSARGSGRAPRVPPAGTMGDGRALAPGAAKVWTVLAWITGLYRSFFGEAVWGAVLGERGRALGAFSRIVGPGGTRERGTRQTSRTTLADSS